MSASPMTFTSLRNVAPPALRTSTSRAIRDVDEAEVMLALAELARDDRSGVTRSKEWGPMEVHCNLRGTSTSISARKGFSLSWEYDPLVADRVNRPGLLTTAAGGRLNLVPPQDFEDPSEDVTPAWVTGLFAGGCGPSKPAQVKRPTGFAPEPEVAKEQSREGSRARIARALGVL